MNQRIDLKAVLSGAGRSRSERVALFALISLGIIESLANGLVSATDVVQVFFHAENCLFVRKQFKVKAAEEIMSHGVQLADLFDALPADQAQREFNRELATIRNLCLRLLKQRRSAA